MRREHCRTCELLKELYRLKLGRFLLAARAASALPMHGQTIREEQVQALKDESLDSLRLLMRHAKACYGLQQDEAA